MCGKLGVSATSNCVLATYSIRRRRHICTSRNPETSGERGAKQHQQIQHTSLSLSLSVHRLQFSGSSSTIDLYGDVRPGARLKLNRFYYYSIHLACVWRALVAERETQRISKPLIDRWMDRSNCNCQSVERRTRQRQRKTIKAKARQTRLLAPAQWNRNRTFVARAQHQTQYAIVIHVGDLFSVISLSWPHCHCHNAVQSQRQKVRRFCITTAGPKTNERWVGIYWFGFCLVLTAVSCV